jgi:hypothetical protein
MKKLFLVLSLVVSSNVMAQNNLSADVTIDDLQFKKPDQGVGQAGSLIFKSAKVNGSGMVLNLSNVNKIFDAQIFLRPTFLGFTTQFGDFGLTLEENNVLTSVKEMQIHNSNLILDDNQLNLSGELFRFVNTDADMQLKNFRLYCQNTALEALEDGSTPPSSDMIKNCLGYLTLNGTSAPGNVYSDLEYKGVDLKTGDKMSVQAKVKSVDIRKSSLAMNLVTPKSVSNDSYTINADNLVMTCAKDPELTSFDINKMAKDCSNQLKVSPLKASIVDKVAKSNFNLDIKDVNVKDKIANFTLNSGTLSDPTSTTYLTNMALSCRKELDTNFLELNQVLKDCLSYARISLAEVKSTKPDGGQASSVKKIVVSSNGNKMVIQADVNILGFMNRVSLSANATLNETKKQLVLNVTDAKLPLGMTSVKMLMYFLKQNIISKGVTYENNNIIISL